MEEPKYNARRGADVCVTAESHVTLSTASVTRDLYHRFFEDQMQINGGGNDGYAAWSDAGGLTMGHYDYSHPELYSLARRYVLADHFYQGSFGGSFLNHQYLICACSPEYPDAATAAATPTIAVLETDAAGRLQPGLKTAPNSPASALDGPPRYVKSGNLAPGDYFGDGKCHAVNTMQPPYQPSGSVPARTDATLRYADPGDATTLPPQSAPTIGRSLDRQAHYLGLVFGVVAGGDCRRHAAAVADAAGDLRAGIAGRQPGFPATPPALHPLPALRSARPCR